MQEKPAILRVLEGEPISPPPIWVMRQAGRYLPEYRATRAAAGSFLDLCYNPELAAEVTLQPIRRFGLDAAILFSDILVVPDALGQRVSFEEGRGPVLEAIDPERVDELDAASVLAGLQPVLETVRRVRRDLHPDKALIGFCGAPWTVATYMIAGHGTPDQAPARRLALTSPEKLTRLLDLLVEASAGYLVAQLRAGADLVMIFDSWAGVLDSEGFDSFAAEPVRRVISKVRAEVPGARVVAFAKGCGARLGRYSETVGADGYGVDWTLPMQEARRMVGPRTALQGNLDPLRLVAGGEALDRGVDEVLRSMAGHPHIFNLGHGITPETPPDNLRRMVERVRRGVL